MNPMEVTMICGIDPGISGAIAWLSDSGVLVEVVDLPVVEVVVGKTKRKQLVPGALAKLLSDRRPSMVILEQVSSRPGEGAVGAFAFGRGYGQIEGVLAALGIPYSLIRPQAWKKALSVPADKGGARMCASRAWPGAAYKFCRVKDDGRAEAALIGMYGCHFVYPGNNKGATK